MTHFFFFCKNFAATGFHFISKLFRDPYYFHSPIFFLSSTSGITLSIDKNNTCSLLYAVCCEKQNSLSFLREQTNVLPMFHNRRCANLRSTRETKRVSKREIPGRVSVPFVMSKSGDFRNCARVDTHTRASETKKTWCMWCNSWGDWRDGDNDS